MQNKYGALGTVPADALGALEAGLVPIPTKLQHLHISPKLARNLLQKFCFQLRCDYETMKRMKAFEYAGGGYFREKGIPKGEVAEIIHAPELMAQLQDRIEELENEV